MTRHSLFLMLCLTCLSAPAWGEETSTRDKVLHLLKGYEYEPGQSN